jgi:hypothetical protein
VRIHPGDFLITMGNFNKHLAFIGERCVLLRGVHCHHDALVFSNIASDDEAAVVTVAVMFASYLLILLAPRHHGVREQAVHEEGGKEVPIHVVVERKLHGIGVLQGGVERDDVAAGGRGRGHEEVHLGLPLRKHKVEQVRLQLLQRRDRLTYGGGVVAYMDGGRQIGRKGWHNSG